MKGDALYLRPLDPRRSSGPMHRGLGWIMALGTLACRGGSHRLPHRRFSCRYLCISDKLAASAVATGQKLHKAQRGGRGAAVSTGVIPVTEPSVRA
jgi:hypothetical protein